MHFYTADIFCDIAPAAFEPLFFDEGLNIKLCAALAMDRTLLERQEESGRLRRRVRIRPQRQVPAALQAVLGNKAVEYVEEMLWQHGSGRGDWTITPNIFVNQVRAYGSVRFVAHPQGTERQVEGDVEVRVFGLGRLAERFIVQDIERSFTDAAALTRTLLPTQGV